MEKIKTRSKSRKGSIYEEREGNLARRERIVFHSTFDDTKFNNEVLDKPFEEILESEYYKGYLLPKIDTCLENIGHDGNMRSKKFKAEFKELFESSSANITTMIELDRKYTGKCDCCATRKYISRKWIFGKETFYFGFQCEKRLKSTALLYDTLKRSSNIHRGYTCFANRALPSNNMWKNVKNDFINMSSDQSKASNEPISSNDSDEEEESDYSDDDEAYLTDEEIEKIDDFVVPDEAPIEFLDPQTKPKRKSNRIVVHDEDEEDAPPPPPEKATKNKNIGQTIQDLDPDDDEEEEKNITPLMETNYEYEIELTDDGNENQMVAKKRKISIESSTPPSFTPPIHPSSFDHMIKPNIQMNQYLIDAKLALLKEKAEFEKDLQLKRLEFENDLQLRRFEFERQKYQDERQRITQQDQHNRQMDIFRLREETRIAFINKDIRGGPLVTQVQLQFPQIPDLQ